MESIATIGDSHRPLRDKVVTELRRRIIDGVYAPGDRLTEDRLADAFGVSRNPVREAIRVLEAEGFLESQPRRGAVVARLSVSDIEDLFDVRLALEPLAAGLVARRAGAAASRALDTLLATAATASDEHRIDELAELNTRFHAAICELSGNTLLRTIMEALHGRLQWVYRQSVQTRAPHSWAEHADLVAAIRAADEKRATDAARAHVLAARTSALTHIPA
jgi:DNA-binding GntR family transcriptional regulator